MSKATEKKLMFAVGALVVIGLVGWYLQRDSVEPEEPTATVEQPQTQPPETQPLIRDDPVAATDSAPEIEPIELPPLEESDAKARETVADVAPKVVAWLTPEQQIRKWAVAIDLAADGALMEKNRPLTYPMSAFKVSGSEGDYRPEASNYGRADEMVGALTSIPPAHAAALYQLWRPLFDEAYKELGKPGSFDSRLQTAIDRALAVKPLSGTPTLVRPKFYYRYADPKLEGASDIEKFMWRLGPDNSAKLQAWLAEVQKAL